jgi:hypothetical protein
MPNERVQRHIERLLDEADQALAARDWAQVRACAQDVLALDAENADATALLAAAERWLKNAAPPVGPTVSGAVPPSSPSPAAVAPIPTAFANGRYQVTRFLGEGGKKRVYLAHDTLLDRDVAFALIKTEGLDDAGRERIQREARTMGRLGAHPHIVSVFDLGDEPGGPEAQGRPSQTSHAGPMSKALGRRSETSHAQPYIVTELMVGGDVEGLIENAPEHRLPLTRALEIGGQVCRGLEFAHAQEVVHRDLKPGNVWLTADGTAKIGDFGLAVALDRSRLTQAGMMVGTVSYMPPEQALGGEITARSDLYSLGAMLYELVTGRPPFVGDEGVAIIGQHLNTAAVAPSWHNPACPPALERLILHLLEKDPGKRPASAAVVREALAGITAGKGSSETAGSAQQAQATGEQAGQSPMYQRAFVGRDQELRTLEAAFDAAQSGRGALVMVVGEPGIGKTTLCEQLATYAAVRGGRTLVGHCYEAGSLSLAYLPFVEALRTYVLSRDPEPLGKELGSGAGEVARIVSEVRQRLAVEPSPPSGDPEEERYRLLQAITSFLRNAAAVQPLVLVLEDLHDADRGTLDLLQHLARNLAGSRLLVIGTYRDIEVDRMHPLSAALAELRRSAGLSRVLLRGLTADEVQRMLATIAGHEVQWGLAEAVHRQTEGNPLFVQEVVRYLAEEGLIKREGGRWRAASEGPLASAIPEGLRDVIGKRLARLSPQCNQVLAVAAVIGREFELGTLRAVAGIEEETLLAALEEALRVAVLQEQSRPGSVRYRFQHAFFRQTLYEELIAPRRLRIHQQVARALELQYANRLEEHAAELADHFAQSTDPADLAKAVEYGELASRRARGVYAYGEAARLLEQAIQVQEVADPANTERRCQLLLALGGVLLPAGEPLRAAEEVGPEGFRLAEALGDRRQASRACQLVLQALTSYGARLATPQWRQWAERGDRYADPNTVDRLYADISLSYMWDALGNTKDGQARRAQALEQARQLHNREATAYVGWLILGATTPEQWREHGALAEELLTGAREGVRPRTFGYLLNICTAVELGLGRRPSAEALGTELKDIAERSRDAFLPVLPAGWETLLAYLDGRLDAAAEAGQHVAARAGESGGVIDLVLSRVTPLLHLGRAAEALAAVEAVSDRSVTLRESTRALCLAHLGRHPEARAALRRLLEIRHVGSAEDATSMTWLAVLLEAAVVLGDRESARLLAPLLAPAAPASMALGYPACPARLLGGAAALLGEREQAWVYYLQALEAAGKIRFRPEIALTHLQLAELLLDGSDPAEHAEAVAHLDVAIEEFRAMKMQPSLERALRHKELLKA